MKKPIQTFASALGLIALSFFLLGCSGGSSTTDVSKLKLYDGGSFTLNVDPSWKVMTPTDFYTEIPKETVVAFTAPEAYNGFFVNVNVVKEKLNQAASSVDYGRANINLSAKTLTDYQKLQEAKITVGGKPALLHLFQARLNPSESLIKFVQLYATQGTNGYIVSGGMLPDTPKEVRDLVGSTVTSFNLKP